MIIDHPTTAATGVLHVPMKVEIRELTMGDGVEHTYVRVSGLVPLATAKFY
jgi:hypothetical protein